MTWTSETVSRHEAYRNQTAATLTITMRLSEKKRTAVSEQLTMYTTRWCAFCRRLKMQLARDGIDVIEVDIEQDLPAADYVMSINGGSHTVPTVVFHDGSALTNPSASKVKERLNQLGPLS